MTWKLRFKHYLAIIAVLLLAGCSVPQNSENSETSKNLSKPQSQVTQQKSAYPIIKGRWATVTHVADGDTVELEGKEKVRLIGVNTPETVKPGVEPMPYGKEASNFTKSQLQGKKVFIELDVQSKDKYGRTLAYLYLQEPKTQEEVETYMFNAILLREGYAQLMTIPPNVKYSDLFVKLQRQAREEKKGIWGLGLYKDSATSTADVFLDGKHPSKQNINNSALQAPVQTAPYNNSGGIATSSKNGCAQPTIKGNINSKGEKIYHVPGGQYYDKTIAEEWFCTEAEAQAAGYRKSKR